METRGQKRKMMSEVEQIEKQGDKYRERERDEESEEDGQQSPKRPRIEREGDNTSEDESVTSEDENATSEDGRKNEEEKKTRREIWEEARSVVRRLKEKITAEEELRKGRKYTGTRSREEINEDLEIGDLNRGLGAFNFTINLRDESREKRLKEEEEKEARQRAERERREKEREEKEKCEKEGKEREEKLTRLKEEERRKYAEAREVYKKRRQLEEEQRTGRRVYCYVCGLPGFTSRNCPNQTNHWRNKKC